MKRKYWLGAGLILLAAVAVSVILSICQREQKLNYIEQIHFQDGYLYYVDRGADDSFRMIRSDVEGRRGDVISCFRYGKETYRTIRQLLFDGQGEVYALVEDTKAASFQAADCRVYRCDFEKGRLVETEYDFTQCFFDNHDIYIQGMREKSIYYFEIPDAKTGTGEVTLCAMDETGKIRRLDSFLLEHPYLKSQFFFSANQVLLWMDYNGELSAKRLGEDAPLEIRGITDTKGTYQNFADDDFYRAFVTDYQSDCIREINLKDMTSDILFTAEEVKKLNPDFTFRDLINLDCTETGFCAGIRNEDREGEISACWYQEGNWMEIDRITLRARAVFRRMLGAYGGLCLLGLLLEIYWYVYCKYRLQTILVRLALVFLLGLLAADHVLEQWIRQIIQEQLERNQTLTLTILGEQLREHITENIEKDYDGFPLGGEDWILNRERMGENAGETESEEIMAYIYSIVRAEEEDGLRMGESMTEYSGVPASWCYYGQSLWAVNTACETRECVSLFEENETGRWNNRFIPLVLSDGRVYGVLTLSVKGNLLDYRIWQYRRNLRDVSVSLMLVLSLVLILVLLLFLRPLKVLKKSAGQLAAGQLGITVPVRGHDEISAISGAFNQMSLGLASYVRDIQELSDGYYRFIPAKILELLGKQSIQQVALGDEMTRDMTILSVYTVNDGKQGKAWSARTVYQEINRLLEVLVASIADHSGVIEHFEDAGLSAFFTESSGGALDAAIEIQRLLEKQQYKGERAIAISYGQVMTGVIGYGNRMEVATISAHSDLAKALRQRGAAYGAKILITHPLYCRISDFERHYHARYLGNVAVSGRDTLERVYDVYDGDDEESFYYKELTKALFEHGVELFVARKFYEARLVFVKVLKQYRKDLASKEYLYRCDKYYKLSDPGEAETVLEYF